VTNDGGVAHGHGNSRAHGFDAPVAHSYERQQALKASWPKNAADSRAYTEIRLP
jgi:hypothetical protein